MSAAQVALLVAYAAGMAGGQLMLKQASLGLPALRGLPAGAAALALAGNGWLLAALALYAALTLLWVWILSFTPLSLAYPFVALVIGATPILAHFVFGEALGWRHLAGLALVLAGLLVMARGA